MRHRLIPWLARVLLAVLLLFASEILLWADPLGRALPDWLSLAAGYAALAALLLDFAARYRVRDVFGLLALAGLYGLLASLLLNPATALADVPRTWATRVLGANTLLGLLALLLFLQMMVGANRRLLAAAGIAGLLWGLWLRWLAIFTDLVPATVALDTALSDAGILLLLVCGLVGLVARYGRSLSSNSLRLGLIGWAAVLAVLVGLLLNRLPTIDPISLAVLLALAIYCGVVLWFEQRDGGQTLLAHSLPPRQSSPALLFANVIAFLAAGAVGYRLPFTEATSPFGILIAVFAAFGLVWLPTVSLVLGVRAYRRMGRQRRL